MTRAKYAISFFSPVQGRVPARPIPILFVAATIKVSSRGVMLESLFAVWSELDGIDMVET